MENISTYSLKRKDKYPLKVEELTAHWVHVAQRPNSILCGKIQPSEVDKVKGSECERGVIVWGGEGDDFVKLETRIHV